MIRSQPLFRTRIIPRVKPDSSQSECQYVGAFSWWHIQKTQMESGSSAADWQHVKNEDFMKKANRDNKNDIRPEYDFASMKGGVRGKYVEQYREGTNLVLIDPELMEAFPTADAVNNALRAVLKLTQAVRPPKRH
jgi:hypothetical protein